MNVTSTSNFNVSCCSCNLRNSLCFFWVESELLFINLAGKTVYRGSSLSVRTIFELPRMGYSLGFGVGGLEKSSKKYSGNCIEEFDAIELGEQTREKLAALSDIVTGSSERSEAVSNPDVI